MSYYEKNRLLARTVNKEPTLTDQSQAHETDINVIVGRFLKTGAAPGTAAQPMYGDFSRLPNGLREFIDQARSLEQHRAALPAALRDLPPEKLMTLTMEEAAAILQPPKPTTEPAKEPTT